MCQQLSSGPEVALLPTFCSRQGGASPRFNDPSTVVNGSLRSDLLLGDFRTCGEPQRAALLQVYWSLYTSIGEIAYCYPFSSCIDHINQSPFSKTLLFACIEHQIHSRPPPETLMPPTKTLTSSLSGNSDIHHLALFLTFVACRLPPPQLDYSLSEFDTRVKPGSVLRRSR